MDAEATLIARASLGDDTRHGTFFAPSAWELRSIAATGQREVRPALHVVRWKADGSTRWSMPSMPPATA